MSPFRFRLATLLRLRIAERDDRRSDLAKALAAGEVLREQRQVLTAERAENLALVRRLAAPGSGNVDAMIQSQRYQAILKLRDAQLAAQEAQVEREIERRRQLLVEADRQVRVLEKLEARQKGSHRQLMEKQEARRLDEVASIGSFRRRRVGS